jgi:hypothetical protein
MLMPDVASTRLCQVNDAVNGTFDGGGTRFMH